MNAADLYIDLLARSVNGKLADGVVHRNEELIKAINDGCQGQVATSLSECEKLLRRAGEDFKKYLEPLGKSVEDFTGMTAANLFDYLNWMNPINSPHTMCGELNVDNLVYCVQDVLDSKVEGDLIETGVWKGGMTVLMRGILKAYDVKDRKVWVADSFEGLPSPDPSTHLKDAIFWQLMEPLQHLTIPFEYVEALFQRYGLLDHQVKFLKGWFCDTLPKAPIEKLAILRMDGDFYESTRDALLYLYPKLSSGGYLIIDDYGIPCGCRRAVDEYRAEHKITAPLIGINQVSVFWKKP